MNPLTVQKGTKLGRDDTTIVWQHPREVTLVVGKLKGQGLSEVFGNCINNQRTGGSLSDQTFSGYYVLTHWCKLIHWSSDLICPVVIICRIVVIRQSRLVASRLISQTTKLWYITIASFACLQPGYRHMHKGYRVHLWRNSCIDSHGSICIVARSPVMCSTQLLIHCKNKLVVLATEWLPWLQTAEETVVM